MDVLSGIESIGLALFIKEYSVLIISDLHIGFEESLNKQGVLVPRLPFEKVLEGIGRIIDSAKPRTVVFNGDIKDAFSSISTTEWRNVKKLIDFVAKRAKIVFIKGNHDTVLELIAKDRNIPVVRDYSVNNIHIMHGDFLPEKLPEILILGHYHPAVCIREKAKAERFKCFLRCNYKKSIFILQPSFNHLTEGGDIRNNLPDFVIPSKTDVFVVDEKTYFFGKLNNLS